MKNWYVYKIEFEDNKFYIGYRGSNRSPDQDFLISYFSSSKVVKERIKQGIKYKGKILNIYDTKDIAYENEQDLIFQYILDPNILNKFCYKNRKGFGLLTEYAKEQISISSKRRWADQEYRDRIILSQKDSWTDERKEAQVKRLKEDFWTDERKESHSNKLKGHAGSRKCKGVKKKEGFGSKISAALTGKSKSEEHKQKLRKPKPKLVCRIFDQKEMTLSNFANWVKRFSLSLEEENGLILP